MEGTTPETAGIFTGEIMHPVEHFFGRFVGEREQHNLARRDALVQEPGDAVGEGAGLTRTGAGQHQHGARSSGYGSVLLGIEGFTEIDRRIAGGRQVVVVAIENEIHEWSKFAGSCREEKPKRS